MTTPGYGSDGHSRPGKLNAGTGGGDPTNEPGQYPGSLFGVALPQGTGAPGTAGAQPGSGDATNQPGQTSEGFAGISMTQITQTGAPGSTGAQNHAGGSDQVTFTHPGSYSSGTYTQETLSDSVSGPDDWTQANDGAYGGGGPQLPGIAGNEPAGTGAGLGRVRRGGTG